MSLLKKREACHPHENLQHWEFAKTPNASLKCGHRGRDDVTKSWSTCVRLKDRTLVACIGLLVLSPDLDVLPPAPARCSPIRIFEGGPSYEGPPSFPSPSKTWIISLQGLQEIGAEGERRGCPLSEQT